MSNVAPSCSVPPPVSSLPVPPPASSLPMPPLSLLPMPPPVSSVASSSVASSSSVVSSSDSLSGSSLESSGVVLHLAPDMNAAKKWAKKYMETTQAAMLIEYNLKNKRGKVY
ncbi:hypothetical protein SPRG_14724, partial [Saprolegnia parasitica CBS 223.65]